MTEYCPYSRKCNHKDCDKDFCERKYRLDDLYNKSLLESTQRQYFALYIDDDNTDYNEFVALANIEQNIENFVSEGSNLFLHSTNCGCGKTSWAIRLIQAYFNKIWPKTDFKCKALFISVPRFLLALKNSVAHYDEYAEFIKANVLSADLVVWDDVGTKIGTTFELDNLFSMIDTRLSMGKSNIFTSNLNLQAMYNHLGERLTSRICNNSIDIQLNGADKRGLNVKNFGGNK